MRARLLVPAVALLALAACGDDGKQGTRGAPASSPAAGPPVPSPTVPPPAPPPSPASGAPAPGLGAAVPRVGDWVRFEVRAPGVDAPTSLRWTAIAVEANRVRLRIESGPLDPSGGVVGARTTEVWAPLPTLPEAPGAPEPIAVGGRSLSARPATRGEFTAWYAAEVPLGGLVRSRGPGGVEQHLVDFGRGS